jgi:tetratricopeptide (TPR) repeat protein
MKKTTFLTLALLAGCHILTAQTEKGDALMKEGKFTEAKAAFAQAITLKPNDDAAYVKRGEAAFGADEFADALEDFDKAIELNGKNASAYFRRAQLMQVLERGDDCLADAGKAIELDPKAEYHYYRGSLFLGSQLNQQAVQDFNTAIQKGYTAADIYYNRAVAYFQNNQISESKQDCDKTIAMKPEWAEPYVMRSQLKLTEMDLDGSCTDAKRALDILKQPFNDTLLFYCNNRNYNTYIILGSEFEQKQLFESAAKAYGKAIEAKPDSVEVYVSRGAMYQNLKLYDKAKADYAMAEQKGVKTDLLYYNWGLMSLQLDDFAKAKYCFDKVLIKQPLPSVYFQRGYCSKKLGKMDDAVADFNKAIELDSSQYAALAHRAFVHISKKDYKKGKADAEASLAIFPDYAYGLLMLGQAKYFLKEQGFCDDFTKASESGLEEAVQAVKEYCAPK